MDRKEKLRKLFEWAAEALDNEERNSTEEEWEEAGGLEAEEGLNELGRLLEEE